MVTVEELTVLFFVSGTMRYRTADWIKHQQQKTI
jgi:hypothetical protein